MLKRTNAHFEELKKIGEAYEERRRAHDEKKQEILDTYGWDSDEITTWYEEKAAMTYPVAAGACKAYRAWMHSIEHGNDEVELEDFLWEKEVADFVSTLKAAGIESFIYTNQSTAVMENLHDFEANDCRMDGLTKIHRIEKRFGADMEETILGIHFTVC